MKKIFAICFCLFFAVSFLLFPDTVKASCLNSLSFCGLALIPSLFPFMVLSNFIVKSGILPPSPFILGMVGGYPVGAEVICSLYREGYLSKSDAESALPLCSLCGPGFVFGVVSSVFSFRFALVLWCAHLLTALPLARFPRVKLIKNPFPFAAAFIESIKAALTSALTVCAFVITFGIICDLIPIPRLLFGILELSRGVMSLANTRFCMALCGFYVSFGGLCVQVQVASLCYNVGLSPRKHFVRKISHGFMTAFSVILLTFFII